jgi:hypothetical protein
LRAARVARGTWRTLLAAPPASAVRANRLRCNDTLGIYQGPASTLLGSLSLPRPTVDAHHHLFRRTFLFRLPPMWTFCIPEMAETLALQNQSTIHWYTASDRKARLEATGTVKAMTQSCQRDGAGPKGEMMAECSSHRKHHSRSAASECVIMQRAHPKHHQSCAILHCIHPGTRAMTMHRMGLP